MTEKQTKFLSVLFAEAKGDPRKAADLAGYSKETNLTDIMGPIQKEIGEKLKESLGTMGSLKAYRALLDVLENSDDPLGRKERIATARDLLDRAGFKATEKVEVEGKNAIFILPPKSDEDS